MPTGLSNQLITASHGRRNIGSQLRAKHTFREVGFMSVDGSRLDVRAYPRYDHIQIADTLVIIC